MKEFVRLECRAFELFELQRLSQTQSWLWMSPFCALLREVLVWKKRTNSHLEEITACMGSDVAIRAKRGDLSIKHSYTRTLNARVREIATSNKKSKIKLKSLFLEQKDEF